MPAWAADLLPLKDGIVRHPYFEELRQGALSIDRVRRGLIGFYPLVEHFPKLMALNLAKTNDPSDPGQGLARKWLIENIAVEASHADWWRLWARGFGCTADQLDGAAPSARMEAVDHYLWHVSGFGSLAEGMAAVNVAIEWATGEWAARVVEGVKSYAGRGLTKAGGRTLAWLTAHAVYDDEHPYQAMAIVGRCARGADELRRAAAAARRGLEYYRLAIDDCYEGPADHDPTGVAPARPSRMGGAAT